MGMAASCVYANYNLNYNWIENLKKISTITPLVTKKIYSQYNDFGILKGEIFLNWDKVMINETTLTQLYSHLYYKMDESDIDYSYFEVITPFSHIPPLFTCEAEFKDIVEVVVGIDFYRMGQSIAMIDDNVLSSDIENIDIGEYRERAAKILNSIKSILEVGAIRTGYCSEDTKKYLERLEK